MAQNHSPTGQPLDCHIQSNQYWMFMGTWSVDGLNMFSTDLVYIYIIYIYIYRYVNWDHHQAKGGNNKIFDTMNQCDSSFFVLGPVVSLMIAPQWSIKHFLNHPA